MISDLGQPATGDRPAGMRADHGGASGAFQILGLRTIWVEALVANSAQSRPHPATCANNSRTIRWLQRDLNPIRIGCPMRFRALGKIATLFAVTKQIGEKCRGASPARPVEGTLQTGA